MVSSQDFYKLRYNASCLVSLQGYPPETHSPNPCRTPLHCSLLVFLALVRLPAVVRRLQAKSRELVLCSRLGLGILSTLLQSEKIYAICVISYPFPRGLLLLSGRYLVYVSL